MRRVPHYRRPGPPPSSPKIAGLRERVVWLLSKRKCMTGEAIAEHLGITLQQFKDATGWRLLVDETSQIAGSERFVSSNGKALDRYYWLKGKPKYVAPKVTIKQTIRVSKKAVDASQEARQKFIDKAARRARLIAKGLYIDEMEAAL